MGNLVDAVRRQVSIKQLAVDGAVLSGLLVAIIMASLRYNAEMWLGDYPPAIRTRFDPMSSAAQRQDRVVARCGGSRTG